MTNISALEQRILESMLLRWGYVIGGAGLRQSLGFASQAALRQAILRGSVPVRLFAMEGRRGHFALTHELAHWLASQSALPSEPRNVHKNATRRDALKNT